MLQSHLNLKSVDSGEGSNAEPYEEKAETDDKPIQEEPLDVRLRRPRVVIPESPVRKLHCSEISVRLSLLGKTANGDGYTYLKVSCTGMKLTDISAITVFEHLQFVDVCDNKLTIDSLQVVTRLPSLVVIHADKNLLTSATLKKMKYMQVMIMNNNDITEVNKVYQPELSTFEVGYNKIERIEFEQKMPTLKVLDFRYNVIKDISNLDFPNLDSLYLAGNKIKNLVGIETLINLRVLHVRANPIVNLNGFDSTQKKLQYINLRGCKIATRAQVKKLKVLEALETLILRGCPYMGGVDEAGTDIEDDVETRMEILATLPKLKRLNKAVVTPEERNEANELLRQWIEGGEPDDNMQELNEEEQDVEAVDEQGEQNIDDDTDK